MIYFKRTVPPEMCARLIVAEAKGLRCVHASVARKFFL
jgi:hypothetical protein